MAAAVFLSSNPQAAYAGTPVYDPVFYYYHPGILGQSPILFLTRGVLGGEVLACPEWPEPSRSDVPITSPNAATTARTCSLHQSIPQAVRASVAGSVLLLCPRRSALVRGDEVHRTQPRAGEAVPAGVAVRRVQRRGSYRREGPIGVAEPSLVVRAVLGQGLAQGVGRGPDRCGGGPDPVADANGPAAGQRWIREQAGDAPGKAGSSFAGGPTSEDSGEGRANASSRGKSKTGSAGVASVDHRRDRTTYPKRHSLPSEAGTLSRGC